MLKKLMIMLLLLTSFALSSCQEEKTTLEDNITKVTTIEESTTTVITTIISDDHKAVFSFNEPHNVTFSLELSNDDFVVMEGDNIAIGNYYLDDIGNLVIRSDFLAGLQPGDHDFTVFLSDRTDIVRVEILNQNQQYRIINSGFETGNLNGWSVGTVFKGEESLLSFRTDLVTQTTSDDANYNSDGNYLFGFDYSSEANTSFLLERVGFIRSSSFILGGSGIISFKLGAGKNSDVSYISIREVETGIEVARFGNLAFNQETFIVLNQDLYDVNLNYYYFDLSDHLGKNLFVEAYDYGGKDYDYMIFDSFEMYNETTPAGAIEATNIIPVFQQTYVTNTLINGDFSQGLNFWNVSNYGLAYQSGIQNCFKTDNEVLKSDFDPNSSKGLIRSSLFRVDGSGVVSFQLGAANGEKYDKDTYISIREYETNKELFRFANRNSNGLEMITYFIDLSEYMGEYLYFEIIDNAIGSNNLIFVDNIITFYVETPIYDYSHMAVNLNE